MPLPSNRSWWSAGGAGPVLVLLALLAGPALAQVPQNTTFTGRLVDGLGNPMGGPVILDLWILPSADGGLETALYAERHDPVALDAQGNFSVLLGTGTNFGGPFPPFDAALFSGVPRYLEVVQITPTFEFLTPRVPIASVPWALVAQQASTIVPDPSAPRFEDCGDGTLADHQTGLQWEKKTGTLGSFVVCATAGCPDPHIVNNLYKWSSTGTLPDGGAFTDFLARLNGEYDPSAATGCFAGHCDWQLPKISELQTILIGPDAAPGQAPTCSTPPCIDPGFAAVGGPTASSYYWSASTSAGGPGFAWFARFDDGTVGDPLKTFGTYVRAVRAGSCN